MQKSIAFEYKLPSVYALTVWIVIAMLAGCMFALAGLPSLYALLALALLIVFGVGAAYYPVPAMSAAIWGLGLCPFVWGLETGGTLPKLFADESLLLLYLAVLPFLYLFTARRWVRFRRLYLLLAVYVCAQALSFSIMPRDLIAFRNFLETAALGPMLLVLFLNEAANAEPEKMAMPIVWLTTTIAALSILERIMQRNPILEHVNDIVYMSSELTKLTEGVYRPYVSFFHPSEAGAFMVLGVPFAIRNWMQKKSALSVMIISVITGGLFVNATRGVWVGAAVVAILLLSRSLWKTMIILIPAAGAGCAIGYLALKNTPFMQRLADPNNLYSRFEYWRMSLRAFADHWLIGVGHMQFRQVYLGYIQDVSNFVRVDLAKVYVVDNMYLTTIVEHGLLGFVCLMAVLVYCAVLLRRQRRELLGLGLSAQASFVRCAELALVAYAVTGLFADLNLFTKATKYFFILVGVGLAAGARSFHERENSAVTEPGMPVLMLR